VTAVEAEEVPVVVVAVEEELMVDRPEVRDACEAECEDEKDILEVGRGIRMVRRWAMVCDEGVTSGSVVVLLSFVICCCYLSLS